VNTATRRKKRQICQVTAQGFSKDYRLIVDASDVGVGAVLLQEGEDDIDLPNCYFSLTFDKDQQKLSTIEKKILALLLSFKHFDVHVIHSWCLQITTPSHLLKNTK
jgi:hypothetical protein